MVQTLRERFQNGGIELAILSLAQARDGEELAAQRPEVLWRRKISRRSGPPEYLA